MIYAIPLSTLIVMIGLLGIQRNHYEFLIRKEQLAKVVIGSGETEKFKKEFEEYKKRVDVLTVKNGFKL